MEALKNDIHQLLQTLVPYLSLDPFIKTDEERIYEEEKIILRFIEKRNAYLKEHLSGLE